MAPPPESQKHPFPATEAPDYILQLLRWHNQLIRTFRFANKDDESDVRIFPILETYSKAKPSSIDPHISFDDAKDLTIYLLDVGTFVAGTKYHKNTHKTIMHLRRFMRSHKVDYVQDTFKRESLILQLKKRITTNCSTIYSSLKYKEEMDCTYNKSPRYAEKTNRSPPAILNKTHLTSITHTDSRSCATKLHIRISDPHLRTNLPDTAQHHKSTLEHWSVFGPLIIQE